MISPPQKLTRLRRLSVDLERRLILAFGSVDSDFCWDLITSLDALRGARRPIKILLNSDGGDEYLGWACVDAIRAMGNVEILGTGHVMSMGSAIFLAGKSRLLTENTRLMVHGGELVFENPSVHHSVMLALGEEQRVNGERYATFIADRVGEFKPLSTTTERRDMRALCLGETYLSAREAVGTGFASKILTPKEYLEWLT